MKFQKLRAFNQGEWLCLEGLISDTHKGPLKGPGDQEISPTNQSIHVPLCMVFKIEKGKIIEVHEYNDQLSVLTQLGIR